MCVNVHLLGTFIQLETPNKTGRPLKSTGKSIFKNGFKEKSDVHNFSQSQIVVDKPKSDVESDSTTKSEV